MTKGIKDKEWLDKQLDDGLANETSRTIIANITKKRAENQEQF